MDRTVLRPDEKIRLSPVEDTKRGIFGPALYCGIFRHKLLTRRGKICYDMEHFVVGNRP